MRHKQLALSSWLSVVVTLTVVCAAALPLVRAGKAEAQNAARPAEDDLATSIEKSNAYIGLMNRTLRAVQSWNRYTSWVNVKTGPTGRERYIDYGLYSLYDVRDEIAKARAAISKPPMVPELDATMGRYIDAYEVLAPIIASANGYYERKDYKADKMAEGKALHAKLVPAAKSFLSERAELDNQMRGFKADLDRRSLAAIEAKEGRSARWHVRNVMVEAQRMIDLLPTSDAPIINVKTFDTALTGYAAAVKEMDHFSEAYPGKFSVFESQPRSLLGKLRDFRDKVARAKGDARRGGGSDLTWIINEYNMMVSTSDSALRFSR